MRRLIGLLFSLWGICYAAWADVADGGRSPYVSTATSVSIGHVSVFDSYLSPSVYTGMEFGLHRDVMRLLGTRSGKWSIQYEWQVRAASTHDASSVGTVWEAMLDGQVACRALLTERKGLKCWAGAAVSSAIGGFYNVRNSNNPGQLKAAMHFMLSGLMSYRFRLWHLPLIARWQADVPVVGAMFLPHYGQSYYEIFGLNQHHRVVHFTSLHNAPCLRTVLSLDFPIRRTNVRLAYHARVDQYAVGGLKGHHWSNACEVGVVKNFRMLYDDRPGLSDRFIPY